MAVHAAIHPLTPGSPAYALAKVGAIGGLVALRLFLSRRSRERSDSEARHETPPRRRSPHPVSRKKRRRRRR